MADKFEKFYDTLESPLANGYLAVPNNSQDLPFVSRAIHANTTGTISVVFKNSTTAVILNVLSGYTYPYRINRINATGTTAQVVVMY